MFFRSLSCIALALSILLPNVVHAQEPPPLEAYGALPSYGDVAVSYSGKYTAAFVNQGEEGGIFLLDENQQVIRRIGAGQLKFRGLSFAGDDFLLIFTSTTVNAFGFAASQYEMTRAIVLPTAAGSEPSVIFGNDQSLSDTVHGNHGVRLVDGELRSYFGAMKFRRQGRSDWAFDHGRPFLYEIDLAEMKYRQLAHSSNEGKGRDWVLAANGTVAATMDIDLADGRWTINNPRGNKIVEGQNATGRAGLIGLDYDGSNLIYYTENAETGESDWYLIPLAGGTPTPFLADIEIKRTFWNRVTGHFLGYQEDSEGEQMVLSDAQLQNRAQAIAQAFAGRNARIVDWSHDMGKAIVHTNGDSDSGTWYYVDVIGLQANAIGYDRLAIEPQHVGPISTIDYIAQDGLEMDGILTLPPGREPVGLPLVVLPHGGPRSRDTESFDWWAQAFASRGYAVFQPNFRGSTNRDEAFIRAGYGEWGRKMQTDISDGVAELARQGIVDPQRACIVGASYGGYAALAGVTIQQGLYRCAVSVGGVSDIWRLYRSETRESGRSGLLRRSLQEQLGDNGNWNAISPRDQAARADAPILLIHGRDDTVVLYEQSRLMADALDDEGKPHRLVELEGEDHWLSLAPTRQQMLSEAVAFVQQHNPPD